MKLVQVRKCDGQCCKHWPRFPNENHSDCIYRDTEGDQSKGCKLRRNPSIIPSGACPVLPELSAVEAFFQTCIGWPQNSDQKLGETEDCCWQWVEDNGD